MTDPQYNALVRDYVSQGGLSTLRKDIEIEFDADVLLTKMFFEASENVIVGRGGENHPSIED